MNILKNLLKTLILVGLIFGVLYFGLSYYYKQQPAPQAGAAPAPSKSAEQLALLLEDLTTTEQKIQDLRIENKPYADEQELVETIKANVARLKKEMASELPAGRIEPGDSLIKTNTLPAEGLFSDPYQRNIIIAVGALLVFLFIFFIVRGLSRKKAPAPAKTAPEAKSAPPLRPARPREKEAAARTAAEVKAGDLRLKETLERFKSASAVIQKSEAADAAAAAKAPPAPAPAAAVPPATKADAPPAAAGKEAGLVEKVFDLSRQGLSIEDIAEKLHVDQDQVRLILRFKR